MQTKCLVGPASRAGQRVPLGSRHLLQLLPMADVFPQLRKDLIVDRWVLIAPERAARPTELEQPSRLAHHSACPFCEGHEAETPPEVHALRHDGSEPNGTGWRVRVVPNRFPAVRDDIGLGYGIHEVVVECPHHEGSLAALSLEQVARCVLGLPRSACGATTRFTACLRTSVQEPRRSGRRVGGTLPFANSATGIVPREIQDELDAAARYHGLNGGCSFCDLLEHEILADERVVWQSDNVVGFVSWAGRFPYETWVFPRRHSPDFDRLDDAELRELADAVRTILQRLAAVAGDPAYNLILHTAPASFESPHYHWHWEILPRTTGIAGYELATGCYLNPLPPEEAATRLRQE